jgi:hypothetical protein
VKVVFFEEILYFTGVFVCVYNYSGSASEVLKLDLFEETNMRFLKISVL